MTPSTSQRSENRFIPVKAPSTFRSKAESRRSQAATKKLPEQLRFQQTSFATRPEPSELDNLDGAASCSDGDDPMEGMVELPGGGYDLRLFKDMTV